MTDAERGGYAVGYFECWNLESLAAAAEAAEARRSPVIVGFSGIYLPQPGNVVRDRLSWYYPLGRSVCDQLSVPACLLFNECAYRSWVMEGIALGFDLVMFSDEGLSPQRLTRKVRGIVQEAHRRGVAVEGELSPLAGAGTGVTEPTDVLGAGSGETDPGKVPAGDPGDPGQAGSARLDEPEEAARFVQRTGVDALAVNIGQAHLHGRRLLSLDQERLARLREAVEVPLVLHGASSVAPEAIRAAIQGGIRKINVGSVLKRVFFDALVEAGIRARDDDYNPYEVIGSGTAADVLAAARLALRSKIEELMELFGSAGQAPSK
jgi:fructose/tagatose bisphosphate aldolase